MNQALLKPADIIFTFILQNITAGTTQIQYESSLAKAS
jgi:hypothetical protein